MIEKKIEVGKQYLHTIMDLEKRIKEGTIDRKIKAVKDITHSCYFCRDIINDFVVELTLKTKIGTQTYPANIGCYYKAKKGYFSDYFSLN